MSSAPAAASAYDPEWRLVRDVVPGIGYHTRLAAGTVAHPTRESMDHAVALLDGADPAGWAVAHGVIATVLELQVTDPTQATYGIWPWYAEEPVARMGPPDWNWADFIGARLCELLVRQGRNEWPEARLPAALAAAMFAALGHAAWSIFRRNVGPGYTNIAIMGAAVALVAGELLGEPRLVAYAAARLRACVDFYAWVGGLSEYNSPTYTPLALEEAERVLRLGRDPAARAAAEALARLAWTTIAEHWHAPTGQWAGPHARCYHDLVQPALAALLAAKSGVALLPAVGTAVGAAAGAVAPGWAVAGPPCPADLAERFRAVVPGTIRRRVARDAAEPARDRWATTWMDDRACLGSISHDSTWTQRRPLLAYWLTESGAVAVLRLRVLKDGRDFAAGHLWAAQDGPRLLAAVGLLTDQGDWHCSLDRPADGAFRGERLVVRVELSGPGAQVEALKDGFVLHAGAGAARLAPAPATLDGLPLAWVAGGEAGLAWVELPLPVGWPLRPAEVLLDVCFALAIGVADDLAAPQVTALGERRTATAGDLSLRWPARPGPQSAAV